MEKRKRRRRRGRALLPGRPSFLYLFISLLSSSLGTFESRRKGSPSQKLAEEWWTGTVLWSYKLEKPSSPPQATAIDEKPNPKCTRYNLRQRVPSPPRSPSKIIALLATAAAAHPAANPTNAMDHSGVLAMLLSALPKLASHLQVIASSLPDYDSSMLTVEPPTPLPPPPRALEGA